MGASTTTRAWASQTKSRRIAAAIMGASLLALAAPLSAEEARAPALLPTPVVPVPPSITRADVEAAVAALDGVVEEAMASTGLPGVAVAVVYEDEVLYEKGFGVREAGRPEPIDTDTVFKLASVSKPIASTIVAGLVGRGDFGFDDPVSTYDVNFALAEPYVSANATFADLMSHRSGLSTGAGDYLEDLGFSRDTILSRLDQQPLDAFRSTYHYSNYGYTAGGEAAALAAGRPWEDLAEEILFGPLGMTRSSYRHADYLSHENRAAIHVRSKADPTVWEARFDRNADAQAPAGGASSSIHDLTSFVRLQLGRGSFEGETVIAPEALAVTHRPHSVDGTPREAARASFYGLGWGVSYDDEGRVSLHHSGAFNLGTATNVTLLPGENLGIVVLTNGEPIGVAEGIAAVFMDIARSGRQMVDWFPLFAGAFEQMRAADIATARASDPAGDPGPARPLEAFAGTYDNSYYGPARVSVVDGALSMDLGPEDAPVTFALTPEEGGHFVFQTIGEWATGPSVAEFSGEGADGAATQLVLGAYDTQGLGTFERK